MDCTVQHDPEGHDATPIVNYRTASPVDVNIMVTYVNYYRRFCATETWQALNSTEVAPGTNVTEHGALGQLRRGQRLAVAHAPLLHGRHDAPR